MDLHFFRLRAVGPPLAVAAVSVAALVWFDKIWIPAQQQYLNERNLRVLRTISAQIKAKVDNFDQAIDHAIDSFPIENGNVELFQKYVKLLSSELEIVTADPKHPAFAKVTPWDPPNVRIQRDDGRNYLYIGYRHDSEHRGRPPITLIARGDLDQVTEPFLKRSDFDALLLLDGHGATIAQQSSSGLELTNVEKLRDRGQTAASGQPGVFDRMRGTTNLAVVTIGAADYVLYAQPVQLSLLHEGKDGMQAPEEWTLCGLVRLDRFRASSSTIPTTYWLCFGAVLALICFAIPVLKLRILSPRERLTRVDSVSLAVAVFMLMALAAFTVEDVRVFGTIVPAAVDEQLQTVSASMIEHVRLETGAVGRQMDAFDNDELWQERLGYGRGTHRNLAEIRELLEASDGADINLDPHASRRALCTPAWSCRSGVLRQLGEIEYPFFRLISWTDDAGWQRIKWSTSVVTPFINVADAKLPYVDSLKLARRLSTSGPGVPMSGVSVLTSPNNGEKLTVFWRALRPSKSVLHDPKRPDLTGVTLATVPVSLTNPVLPKNVQFAVVDRAGRVLFHGDSARSLTENFFQESEESPRLKSLVASRDSGTLTARYLGRAHRFFVRPLDVAPFGDPRWSLVVFQADAVSETANLGTINLAASMFVLYALALAAIWAVLGFFWPDGARNILWPIPARALLYRRAAMVGTAAGLAGMAGLALGPSPLPIAGAAALVVCAVVVMFLIVHAGSESSRSSSTWLAGFFWARASLLFLLAAVPATLCFHVAYAFHTDLVVKRAQSHLATELGARARRINAEAKRVAVCSESDSGTQPCAEIGTLVARRTTSILWDVHVPASGRIHAAPDATVSAPAALRSFLNLAYRPYNDIAADLLMTSAPQQGKGPERWRLTISADGKEAVVKGDTASDSRFASAIAPRPPVNGEPWTIVVALMGVAYALVRYFLQPIFALGLEPTASLRAATGSADDTSLLVLGPPGSRRTERLHRHPRVRIFDVRTLAFADSPMAATLSDIRATAADCGHFDHPDADWSDAIQAATSHPFTIVALDHLEHRLDDERFRGRMLECLESAVYRHGAAVWCSSVRDPIELLDALDPPAPDRPRWARVLQGFRREHLALEIDRARSRALAASLEEYASGLAPDVRALIVSECEVAPELLAIGENLAGRLPTRSQMSGEQLLAEIASGARPFYEALWGACTTDERVALRQLAEEGLVNPNNPAAISRLLAAGLVRRSQTFQFMNETFRRFVIGAAPHDVIAAWEREGVRLPWGTIATTGVTVAFGLAGLLLLTQEQLVDAWISYVPALAPAIPTVWKVLATAQKGRLEAAA